MKDDGSWIHGSRMKLDIGCWLMDHGWMGEAGFWTCPEALEWVVGGCKVVLRSWDASGLFWVKVSGGFGGGFAGRGPENLGMAPEEARAGARGGAPGRTASWAGSREPWVAPKEAPPLLWRGVVVRVTDSSRVTGVFRWASCLPLPEFYSGGASGGPTDAPMFWEIFGYSPLDLPLCTPSSFVRASGKGTGWG